MHLIVGLGNPGGKYAGNRHNVGFMALDAIAEDWRLGPWKSRFSGQTAEGVVETGQGPKKVLLLKPQTFYNESGRAVAEAARFYKIDADKIVVFHDELDLAPGKFRLKTGGGHAGNNGLRSTKAHIDYLNISVCSSIIDLSRVIIFALKVIKSLQLIVT